MKNINIYPEFEQNSYLAERENGRGKIHFQNVKKELVRPVKFGIEIICWICYRKVPYAEKVKAA